MKRTRVEYRITVKRARREPRFVVRYSEATLRRFLTLLGPEPWKAYAPDADGNDYVCCPGTRYEECGCGGETHEEHAAAKRKEYPPLQWVKVETRTRRWEVGQWSPDLSLTAPTRNALVAVEANPDDPDAKWDKFSAVEMPA